MIHIPALSNFAIMGQRFLPGFFVGSSQISMDGQWTFSFHKRYRDWGDLFLTFFFFKLYLYYLSVCLVGPVNWVVEGEQQFQYSYKLEISFQLILSLFRKLLECLAIDLHTWFYFILTSLALMI